MKDGAGEAAGGRWKSSRGGTRAPSALRRTLRCFVALPRQGRCNVNGARSWKEPGISSEGKKPHSAAFAELSTNLPPHRRGPRGTQPQGMAPEVIEPHQLRCSLSGSVYTPICCSVYRPGYRQAQELLIALYPPRFVACPSPASQARVATLTTYRHDLEPRRNQRQGLRTTPQRGGGQQHPSCMGARSRNGRQQCGEELGCVNRAV